MENDNWPPIICVRNDSSNVKLISAIEAATSEARPGMPRVNVDTGWSFRVSSSDLTIFRCAKTKPRRDAISCGTPSLFEGLQIWSYFNQIALILIVIALAERLCASFIMLILIRTGMPKAHSNNVNDLALRPFGRGCTPAHSVLSLVYPWLASDD